MTEICSVPDGVSPDSFEIVCQNGHCSDLALVCKPRLAISIEAKIDSPLDEHQKPWSNRFLMPGKPDGYGVQLAKRFVTCEEIRYVVLQKDLPEERIPPSVKAESRKILCSARTWRDFGAFDDRNSPLVRDFVESIAEFGIPSLKLRRFHTMNMVPHARDAAVMHQLLVAVAGSVDVSGRQLDWEVNSGVDGSYYGLHLPGGAPFKRLQQLSGVGAEPLGWFGYEAPADEPPRVAVWNYPTKSRLNEVKSFIMAALKVKLTQRDDALFITSEMQGSDAEWFETMLRKLCDSSDVWLRREV